MIAFFRRVSVVALVSIATLVLFAASVDGALNPVGDGTIEVKLETVARWTPAFSGSEQEVTATELAPMNDGTGRLLVATLGGTLRVIDANGTLLSNKLLTNAQTGVWIPDEGGMTGIALHPDFANPATFGFGKLYTITTEGAWNNGGVTNEFNDFPIPENITEEHQDVIREWDISSAVGDANVNSLPSITLADSREILRMDQQGPWHNMTDLAFNTNATPGSDDYGQLYASVGDGWAGAGTLNAPQQPQMLDTIWGNILRINPDPNAHALVRTSRSSGLPAYSVSPLNPYNGDDGTEGINHPDDGTSSDTLAEIYANGFRSPYRLTFDDETGKLYVGDVGQNAREEITEVGLGDNAGWGRWEGSRLFNGGVSLVGNSTHTGPIFEYDRNHGRLVTGGYVYRGSAIPELYGKYVFLDFGYENQPATLFYGTVDPLDQDYGNFYRMLIDPSGDQYLGAHGIGDMPEHVFSVGVDSEGELYLVAGENPLRVTVFPDSYIIKLTASPIPGDFDNDGDLDGADFLKWQTSDGTSGGLSNWLAEYGNSIGSESASGTVPEPTGVCLSVTCMLILNATRRHASSTR